MKVARVDETDDVPLGPGGQRALEAERDENRQLRARIRFLESMVMHCSNMIVDAVEQTRGLKVGVGTNRQGAQRDSDAANGADDVITDTSDDRSSVDDSGTGTGVQDDDDTMTPHGGRPVISVRTGLGRHWR